MLTRYFFIPIPMTIAWILLTNRPTLESALVGYVLSVILVTLFAQNAVYKINLASFPLEVFTLVVFTIRMLWNMVYAGIDVALRIIGRRPINPGIIAVPIQHGDENDPVTREILAGASAHTITITPGELVVDYNDDRTVMYVHTLDVNMSGPKADSEQTKRMQIFKRILGRD